MKTLMKTLLRLLRLITILTVFGMAGIVLTFFLVSLTPQGQRLAVERAQAAWLPRMQNWVTQVVTSRFTDWGESPQTGQSVTRELGERYPVTVGLSLISWGLAWSAALAVAILLVRWYPSLADGYLRWFYPMAQAVPAVALLLPAAIFCLRYKFDASGKMTVGIIVLTVLLIPSATALWLSGIQRTCQSDFVRAAHARGLFRLAEIWLRHVLPNAIVSSSVLSQAAISLSQLLVDALLVESVLNIPGMAAAFVTAVTEGFCEMAATAVVTFFVPLALGVTLAEGLVLSLDPNQEVKHDA